MKQFKSAVILCVVAVVMLFTSLLVYINFQAYKSRKSAEELLQDLRGMKVGETTRLDAQQLAHTHRFFLGKASPFQQNEWQTYSFFYESYDSESHLVRWIRLWRLHLWTFQLAPIECNFSATLDVNRDTLDRVTMSMTSGIMPHPFTLTVTDEAPEISPVAGSYVVDDARPQYFVIYLKPNATRSQREFAYSFNLKCLDKIGGCRDKYELLMGSAIPNQQAADGSGKDCDENCTNGLKSMQWAGPEFPSRKSKYFQCLVSRLTVH